MEHYILLMTLTPEGQAKTARDPEQVLLAQDAIAVPGVEVLGLYGVLGEYDFVTMLEAPDNDTVARFSVELGVRAGVHITTLPAIPIARFEAAARRDMPELEASMTLTPEEE